MSEQSDCQPASPARLVPVVERTIPHDTGSYTQGLLVDDGVIFESVGRYGESRLNALDPADGSTLDSVALPDSAFGEGLTVSSQGELVQLTWKEGVAFRWSKTKGLSQSKPVGEFRYDGEGWGLATLSDGALAMSNGSDTISVRDGETFEVISQHKVARLDGGADRLNELEWDGEALWANRYQTNEILRIETDCWTVTGVVDATSLHDDALNAAKGIDIDVLNGIAALPESDQYLVTGKWWPKIYSVRIVAEGAVTDE